MAGGEKSIGKALLLLLDGSLKADSQYQKRSDQRPTTAPRLVAVLSQGVAGGRCDRRLGRRPSFHRNVEHDFRKNYMFTMPCHAPCRSFFWSALPLRIFLNFFNFVIILGFHKAGDLSRGFPQVNLFQVLTV